MNILTQNLFARTCLAFAWALALTAIPAQAKATTAPAQPSTALPANKRICQSLDEQRQAIVDNIKIQDALLLEKVSQMHRATGDNKINLIADIVTDLVKQRIAVNQWKAKMEEMINLHQSLDTSL